jgi:hypothetical protein
MTTIAHVSAKLTDDQLLDETRALARRERDATVQLIAALMELDTRRLYLGQGYSSLFTYCTRALHLSESAAYSRLEAARAARRFPVVLDLLVDGALTLTTVCLLSRHLTTANHRAVVDAARYCSKREVEAQIAALQPQPPVLPSIRKLPTSLRFESRDSARERATFELPLISARPSSRIAHPHERPQMVKASHLNRLTPLAPDRYKVQLTVNRETHDKLREAQDLMRHRVPNGDLASLFDRAITLLVEDLRRQRWADTASPRAERQATPGSRHVPAAVKREVWKRDGGRCAFVGAAGRCGERGLLEVHHVVPFADGGPTTSANLQLRCRAHNAYEAQQYFGEWLTG